VKTLFDYQVVCRRDDNAAMLLTFLLSRVVTQLESPEEALKGLQNVFDMISEEFSQRGTPLPNDVQLTIGSSRD